MRLTVFDYGAGNLHSLIKAMDGAGREILVETDARAAIDTDLLVLPGVGAFASAAAHLAPGRAAMRDALRDGLPCLGICLGMQLLFERSDEGDGEGLGIIAGEVTRLHADRVPHIGWNDIEAAGEPLLDRSGLGLAWFANGYACRPVTGDCVTGWTTHQADRFPAIVRTTRTLGVQFHPEKSSAAGLRFVRAALDELAGVPA